MTAAILASQNGDSRRLTILQGSAGTSPFDLTPTAAEPLLEFVPGRAGTADPYQAYLDTLDATTSRPTMRGCLDRIARIVLEEEAGAPLPYDVTGACRTWERIRHEHATHIRALLIAQQTNGVPWSPSSVNKHLSALRQVLKTAWRLRLMSTDDYHRAADITNLKGTRLPTGRSERDPMSSDYSPFDAGPPIVHRDELGALRRPPAPDEDVSPHLPAAQELMAQARQQGDPEPFPAGWAVTCESGRWSAELRPPLALTLLEEELGYDRLLERPTRGDLLAAVHAREAIRSAV